MYQHIRNNFGYCQYRLSASEGVAHTCGEPGSFVPASGYRCETHRVDAAEGKQADQAVA